MADATTQNVHDFFPEERDLATAHPWDLGSAQRLGAQTRRWLEWAIHEESS